jgi:hypothetical protein
LQIANNTCLKAEEVLLAFGPLGKEDKIEIIKEGSKALEEPEAYLAGEQV